MELTREQLHELLKKLPQDMQDAIFSSEVAEILLSLGKKYGLSLDKVGELSDETENIILGLSHPRDFIPALEKSLGVNREIARQIAQEVNTLVFSRIRESLKKLHNIQDEELPKEPISGAPAFAQKPSGGIPSPAKDTALSEDKLSGRPPYTPITPTTLKPTVPPSPPQAPYSFAPSPEPKSQEKDATSIQQKSSFFLSERDSAGKPSFVSAKVGPASDGKTTEGKKLVGPTTPVWRDVAPDAKKPQDTSLEAKETQVKPAPTTTQDAKQAQDIFTQNQPAQEIKQGAEQTKKLEEEIAPFLKTLSPQISPYQNRKEIPLPPKPKPTQQEQKEGDSTQEKTLTSSPFESKTKEEIFHAPAIESSKAAPIPPIFPSPSAAEAIKKTEEAKQNNRYPEIDPYREQIDPKDMILKKQHL